MPESPSLKTNIQEGLLDPTQASLKDLPLLLPGPGFSREVSVYTLHFCLPAPASEGALPIAQINSSTAKWLGMVAAKGARARCVIIANQNCPGPKELDPMDHCLSLKHFILSAAVISGFLIFLLGLSCSIICLGHSLPSKCSLRCWVLRRLHLGPPPSQVTAATSSPPSAPLHRGRPRYLPRPPSCLPAHISDSPTTSHSLSQSP